MDKYEKAVRWRKFWFRFLFFILPIVIVVLCFIHIDRSVEWKLKQLVVGLRENWYISLFSISGLYFLYRFQLKESLRRLRYRFGRCHKCGYDLRHKKEGQCPECGHFVDPIDTWWEEITGTKKEES